MFAEEQLVETERRRLAALVDSDLLACETLHADDYELITPGGARLGRAAYLARVADDTLTYRRFEPEGDMAVRLLGDEAAAVRYRVNIDVTWSGGSDTGKFWHTDLYERREGRWQAVWSHATRISADGGGR